MILGFNNFNMWIRLFKKGYMLRAYPDNKCFGKVFTLVVKADKVDLRFDIAGLP